jgi:hypothetical protein
MTALAAPARKRKVPAFLIYETMDGRDLYYKGYKSVLNKKTTLEGIMGASGLQSIIITFLMEVLFKIPNRKKYHITTGESGLHIDHRNNLANDIGVYDKQVLTPDLINTKYISVAPTLAIEIDIKADYSDPQDAYYVQQKTQKLLDFGVEKIVWVFSGTQKIMVATPNENWQIMDWSKDINLIDGISANIASYLKEEGIQVS